MLHVKNIVINALRNKMKVIYEKSVVCSFRHWRKFVSCKPVRDKGLALVIHVLFILPIPSPLLKELQYTWSCDSWHTMQVWNILVTYLMSFISSNKLITKCSGVKAQLHLYFVNSCLWNRALFWYVHNVLYCSFQFLSCSRYRSNHIWTRSDLKTLLSILQCSVTPPGKQSIPHLNIFY